MKPAFRTLLPFGGSPRIHAGEERFRAFYVPTQFVGTRSEKAPLKLCALALGISHPPSRTRGEQQHPSGTRQSKG
jgi:hypothetical protein